MARLKRKRRWPPSTVRHWLSEQSTMENKMRSSLATNLFERLESRHGRAGVVGLGYVGLPLAVELAHGGLTAIGLDLDVRKVDAINRGESYIPDVDSATVAELVSTGRLQATT